MPSWLQSIDHVLFRFINDTLSCVPLDVLLPLLDSNSFFVPAVLLGMVLLVWRGGVRGRLFVALLALALCLGETCIVGPLKDTVGRPRPFAVLEGVRLLSGRGGSGSLPSAHTTLWFASTLIAYVYYPRSARFLLPMAGLMAFSRVYMGVHYPSDVLAGAALGAGYAAAVVWSLDAAWRRFGPRWFPLWWQRLPTFIVRGPATLLPARERTPAELDVLRDRQYLHLGWIFIGVILLLRLAYISSDKIQLSEDEAYQWLWSKNPALSYFSKPPLIAYTQWLGTHIWGDSEFGVRFFSPVISAVLASILLQFLARTVSARVGFFTMLLLNLAPLMEVGSLLMTVDPLLVLCWTVAMVAGWRAVQPDGTTAHWLWVGLWTGLGFLSKYTALAQLACWAVFFVLHPPARVHLRRPGPWLAVLVTGLCTLPVLIWNAQHGWVTLGHLSDNARMDKPWQPTLGPFLEFTAAQAGLLNPLCFGAALWASVAFWKRAPGHILLRYLFAMGAPLFLGYWLFTFHARAHPNWIAAAVVPLFCHLAVYWDLRWRAGLRAVKPWLVAALLFGGLAAPFLHEPDLTNKGFQYRLPPDKDPLRRVRAIDDIARAVARERNRLLAEGRPVFVLTSHYGPAGQLSFYLPEARDGLPMSPLVYCLLGERPRNQFFFWPHYRYREQRRGQNAVYVQFDDGSKPAPPAVQKLFRSVTDLGVTEIKHNKRVYHRVHVFACRDLL